MLRGERVVLRAIQREDLPRLWELFEDLEVRGRLSTRPPRPTSLAELEAEFDREQEEPPEHTFSFAIEINGEVIGSCQLHRIDHYRGLAELGIGIRRDYWNKGYGQDAVRTLVEYAFHNANLRRVSLEVLADDPRAVSAYRGAGFVEEGRLRKKDWYDGAFHDSLVMAILRDEWAQKGADEVTGA
jgi:RimJ/RimL family protein N-acetyltransferase